MSSLPQALPRIREVEQSIVDVSRSSYAPGVHDPGPFAHVLHLEMLAKLANGAALSRGRAYVAEGRVESVSRRAQQLVGVVRGTARYAVSIWIRGDGIGYACSCPAGAEGVFCKHCVAIAIDWIERSG